MLVLVYHGVRPADDMVSPDIRAKHVPELAFSRQLSLLGRLFRVISLSEAVSSMKEGRRLPWNACVLTFDDGYANNAETAAPILEAHGMPATFFITTDFVDGRLSLWVDRFEVLFAALPGDTLDIEVAGEHLRLSLDVRCRATSDKRLRERLKKVSTAERDRVLDDLSPRVGAPVEIAPLHRAMSWDQARRLVRAGFEVGAHTRTHPILSHCAAEQLEEELGGSKSVIERECGAPCAHFAYPNGQPGDWNETVLAGVRRYFESCSTTVSRFVGARSDPYAIPRVTEDAGSDLLKFAATVTGIRSILSSIRSRQ
jgi:peptidoglycan/xylan/chitin deacetylase (PgdA/CDA1 family)